MGTFPFIVILVCVLGLALSPLLFVYVFHHFDKRFEQKYQQLGNLVEIHVTLSPPLNGAASSTPTYAPAEVPET